MLKLSANLQLVTIDDEPRYDRSDLCANDSLIGCNHYEMDRSILLT